MQRTNTVVVEDVPNLPLEPAELPPAPDLPLEPDELPLDPDLPLEAAEIPIAPLDNDEQSVQNSYERTVKHFGTMVTVKDIPRSYTLVHRSYMTMLIPDTSGIRIQSRDSHDVTPDVSKTSLMSKTQKPLHILGTSRSRCQSIRLDQSKRA